MNIKDLKPGSYKVIQPSGGNLNINDLPPGSYNTNPSGFPTEEPPEVKSNFFKRLSEIGKGFVKGVGASIKDTAETAGVVNKIPDSIRGFMEYIPGFNIPIRALQAANKLGEAIPQEAVETTNDDQRIGYGIEKVTEFALPTGAGAKVAASTKTVRNFVKGEVDDVLKSITPNVRDLTPTEYEKLLNAGKIQPKTATKPAQYILSDSEKEAAQRYQNLVKNKDPVKNTINVIGEIAKKDEAVGAFLQENNAIFNGGELRNSILNRLDDITDISVDQGRLDNAKAELVVNFINKLKKKDMVSLWKARKEFDKTIEKAFSGSPTLQNTIKREFRNAIQDFISSKTDDATYKGYMKEMAELFDIRDVLTTKANKEKMYSGIGQYLKEHPGMKKTLQWVLPTTIGAAIGSQFID